MSRDRLATFLVAGTLVLGAPAASSAAGGSDPYFGSNLDCSPVLTDRQALDLTQTTRNVVESVKTGPGPRDYLCSWSVAGKGRGMTVVVGVTDWENRSTRSEMWKGLCDPSNPLPRDLRKRLCAASEDVLRVASRAQALEAYTTLMQAVSGRSGKTKLRLGDGRRGYWVGGASGGAVAGIAPGWTLVHTACLNLAMTTVERECSIELLETVLRNFRMRAEEFCVGLERDQCKTPLVTPVPKTKRR